LDAVKAEEKLPSGFAIVLLEIDETTPAEVMLHIQAAVTRAESVMQPAIQPSGVRRRASDPDA